MTAAEEWRAIPGWEGMYEVSDHGRVRSLPRTITINGGACDRPGVVLAACPNSTGYAAVRLARAGTKIAKQVHALVLEVFVGPRPEGMEGCHSDGDRLNNRLDNLRWDTRSANQRDAVRHRAHREARKTHCLRGHPFSGDNLVTHLRDGRVRRRCRECDRAAWARANAARKAAS